MTVHYLDSSVWAKRYFGETGSELVHELFVPTSKPQETIAVSWLGCIEVAAAIARRYKTGGISPEARFELDGLLDSDWLGASRVRITPDHFKTAFRRARGRGLKGADAVHPAIAEDLNGAAHDRNDEFLFWTADGELVAAAQALNIPVVNPGKSNYSPQA